jgi:hypothetical protein
VLAGIDVLGNIHPDLISPHFNREGANIVGELVKCAAAFEVKAGVVPMAGEDTVLHRSFIQRKTHMGAAIVDGVDSVVVGEEGNDMAIELNGRAALVF